MGKLSETPEGTKHVATQNLRHHPKLRRRSSSVLAAFPNKEKGQQAMIARLDHHPVLTAVLALTTAMLVVVVIALATLLLTAEPPAVTSSSEGGANPGVGAAPANMDAGGENYGHGAVLPQPAQSGNFADPNIDRHAEVVAAYQNNR